MGGFNSIINTRESETKKNYSRPMVLLPPHLPNCRPPFVAVSGLARTGVSAGHSSRARPTGARYIEALIYGMPRCDAPLLAVGDSASGRRLQLWLRPQPVLLPWTCRAAGRCPCRDLDRSVALGRPRTAEHAMCPPPCLINTAGSMAGQGRDRMPGRRWLAVMPQDASTGGCVVRVQSHLPHHGQRQHAPSGLPAPVGVIRKNVRNSPFLLAKRYRRVQLSSNATYIILRHQGTYRLGSALPHSSTQLIKVLNFFSPFIQGTKRGDRQVVFPVGLLVRNGADGRRAGVPSLHSMPAGLAIQFTPTQETASYRCTVRGIPCGLAWF